MSLHWVDWACVAVPLAVVAWVAWRVRRYVHGVADFMAAGRCAGRYLLAVAGMETNLSIIGLVATCELVMQSGFTLGFWKQFAQLTGLFITLSGFVVYRYRQTRVLSLGQFLEVRYSRRFRTFAGSLAYIAGVLNYALFPAVSARFLMYYAGFPDTTSIAGVPVSTFGLIMLAGLGVAVTLVMMGGTLTSLVTDCVQGLFSYALLTVITITVLVLFSQDQFRAVLLAQPAGKSFVNPFDTGQLTEFNILYVLIGMVVSLYGVNAWQGAAGYQVAGFSPHEQKMGGILGRWREGLNTLKVPLLVLAALVVLRHPDFAKQGETVRAEIQARIQLATPEQTETMQRQMTVPIAVRHVLPIGVTGALLALMVFAMISTDTTYLHSWGSILVQDVLLPVTGERRLSPRAHLWLLRLSVLAVAVFAWCFSFWFGQVTFIFHFFAVTGAVWVGGAGACIIGGLYSRRGTTTGAWGAMVVGSSLGLIGFLLQKFWAPAVYPWLAAHAPGVLGWLTDALTGLGHALPIAHWEVTPTRFPLSGMEWSFLTIVAAVTAYVGLSWLSYRESFNLDRMLHRGAYAPEPTGAPLRRVPWYHRLVVITAEFTRGDRILAWSVFAYLILQLAVFAVVVVWNLSLRRWPEEWWFQYFWYWNICQALVVGLVTSVWFTWGGLRDLRRMFAALKVLRRDARDDGRVVGHVNAMEVSETEQPREEKTK